MPEDVLFADEGRRDRGEIAAYLRSVSEKLESGQAITFTAGERSVTVEPPARPTFEVKVERETDAGEDVGELSVEIELEWDESAGRDEDASLSID